MTQERRQGDPMEVALYPQMSTSQRDQDPEARLLALREFVHTQCWETYQEYVDQAPAIDLANYTAWRQLLDDASRRRFDLLLVWRMDRAFRSVQDAATLLPGATRRLGCWATLLHRAVAGHDQPLRRSAVLYITVAHAQL